MNQIMRGETYRIGGWSQEGGRDAESMNEQNDEAREERNGPLIHFRPFGFIYFVFPRTTNEFFILKATCIDDKLFGVIKTIC